MERMTEVERIAVEQERTPDLMLRDADAYAARNGLDKLEAACYRKF